MSNTQMPREATLEQINEQVLVLTKAGYGAVVRGDQLVKFLGLSNSHAMRMRYRRGQLPFLSKDEGGFCATIKDLARYLVAIENRAVENRAPSRSEDIGEQAVAQ